MVRAARAQRALSAALLAALAAAPLAPIGAVEADGDVYVSLRNDDADPERWGSEISWVEPLSEWLKSEIGASYAQFDSARWGYGVLGAHLALPGGRDHVSLRGEYGAGRGDAGAYGHGIGKADWTHALLPGAIFSEVGFELIRVEHVEENLARVGVALVPLDWLLLHADFRQSVFGGEGTQAWSGRSDFHLSRSTLFAGYARSEDTVDLRSIGGSAHAGRPTHEVFLGIELPIGRHGVTLAASRYESDFDTRYSVNLSWRWNLYFLSAPAPEAATPLRGRGAGEYARAPITR